MTTMIDSPAKCDTQLLNLATAYRSSNDGRARNMIRGKAQRLINQFYHVQSNREAVWSEWCILAEPNENGWLRRGN